MKYKRTFIVFSLIVIIGVALIVINHHSTVSVYVLVKSTNDVVVRKLENRGKFYYTISEKGNDWWLEANILEAKPLLRDSKHLKKAIPVDSLVFLFWKDFYTRKKWPYDVYLISTDSTNGSIMEYKVDIRCFIE